MADAGKNFTLNIVPPISEKNLRVNYDKRILVRSTKSSDFPDTPSYHSV